MPVASARPYREPRAASAIQPEPEGAWTTGALWRRFGVCFPVAVVVAALVLVGGLLVCWLLLLAHAGGVVWAAFGLNAAFTQL